ncbi:MAG: hypothetical protein OEU94_05290 [Aquincola sp.]|nr:hypothetical protein [Aquincola sp.]MDH5328587.1 hypothetical protein [Aquincola sp.]
MNTRIFPLHRPLYDVLAEATRDALSRLRQSWLAYRERRQVELAERELLALSARTLEDIGAPYGLIGQRRWQDERQGVERDRLLDRHGW